MTPSSPGALHASRIPRLDGLDHSRQLFADPYRFIGRQCALHGSDVIEARIFLQRTLLMRGPLAAELFYDPARFRRAGATPRPVLDTLFGRGGVQGLDGTAHLRRKQFFTAITGPAATADVLEAAEGIWQERLPLWEMRECLSLYVLAQDWLWRTALRWAGVSLAESESALRRAQVVALFDGAGAGLAGYLQARRARAQAEAWLGALVERARHEGDAFPPGSPAMQVALLANADGRLLPVHTAAVELLNLLRPITAISVFVVLAAHALHAHPRWREPLADGDDSKLQAFVQEVRRFYPFFPAVVARTCSAFAWCGMEFPQGVRAMLDLYGTNHDARAWSDPEAFRPERFIAVSPGLFAFVPQGGGRADRHHRCPGEGFTIALVKMALRKLAAAHYELPAQQFEIDMTRLPALPRERLLMRALRGAA